MCCGRALYMVRCTHEERTTDERSTMPNREFALVVDVETCGPINKPLVYDLGYAVIERRTGRIITSNSIVIGDIFHGENDLMRTAYYADKVPQYYRGIKSGEFAVMPLWTAWNEIRSVVKQYGIKRIYAYNMAFDKRALNNTMQHVTGGKYSHFFPAKMQYCCIWNMACQTILSQKRYRKFAEAHGLVSPAGNLRTSAEAAYAYLTNNPAYAEPHTGLADVHIEIEIMQMCLRQKKRTSEKIIPNPWKIPQVRSSAQMSFA